MARMRLAAIAGDGKDRKGALRLLNLDVATGRSRLLAETTAIPSPSFLAHDAISSTLYVASEIGDGDGRVTPVSLEGDRLTPARPAATGGSAAVHLALDRQSRFLFAANYQPDDASGPVSVAVFRLEADGTVGAMTGRADHAGSGPDTARQSRPHCHAVAVSPDNRLLAAIDLGTDSAWLYRFSPVDGSITLLNAFRLSPGSGPRHCVFHPSQPLLYVNGELDSSMMTLAVDTATGEARLVATEPATAQAGRTRNYPSGIAISPDGHFLLGANRGADTVAVFWIDPETGAARLRSETPCGGAFPRAIRFDPPARLLAVANQKSGDISIFGWDFSDGRLSGKPLAAVDVPAALDMIFVG